jgi:hypothetical protein
VTATLTPPRMTPTRSPRRSHRGRWIAIAATLLGMVVLAPVVLFAGAGNPPCTTTTPGTGTGTTPTAGTFAAPLQMQVGRWYRVGATEYGGPDDPTSGLYGSSGAYLPAEPDSFAELSLLDSNPANGLGALTFADADALGGLPYGTAIRVVNDGRSMVLVKRDIGYGQGPGQAIPYRIDVWWSSAQKLAITKTAVQIQLLPHSGAGAVLDQIPARSTTPVCGSVGTTTGPMPSLNDTSQTQIGSNGLASAPADAPRAVKLAVGAADQIADLPYPDPDVHYDAQNLTRIWPAYDCSATVSYVLYRAGLRGSIATNAAGMMSYGDPGPGRWISIYANTTHTWIVIAGRAFDTSHYGAAVPAGTGPRWLTDPTGNLADGLSYVVRHPPGL